MQFRFAKTMFAAAALAVASFASAATIIDTGPGQPEWGGFTASAYQQLGAKVHFGGAATVTGVDGWLAGESTVIISLYDNVGNAPGSQLFSGSTITHTPYPQPSDWYGITGLDWQVAAGDYWVVFSGLPEEYFTANSFMNPMSNSAIGGALTGYGYGRPGSYWNDGNDFLYIGMRMFGDVAQGPVGAPEPAAFALLGFGLAGIAMARRRRTA